MINISLSSYNDKSKLLKRSLLSFSSIVVSVIAFISLSIYIYQVGLGYEGKEAYIKLAFYLWIILSTLGICLAIVGLFQKKRDKLFSIIGLISNLVILVIPLIFYLLLWATYLAEKSG